MDTRITKKFEEDANYKKVREKLMEESWELDRQKNIICEKIQLWDSINGIDLWDKKGGI